MLSSLKGNPKKQKIATLDIEASNWVNFVIAGFYDGKNYYELYTVDDIIKLITSRKYYGYRIYAHNGGKYDFLFLIDKLKRSEVIYVNSSILEIRIGHMLQPNGKYKYYTYLVDSLKILPMSLRKLGEEFVGMKKFEINYEKIGLNDETKAYLKRDVILLYQVIEKFQDTVNELGGNMKLTIASTAMDIFRRRYLTCENLHNYYQYDNFVRSGYYGGRVEVFKPIMRNGYYYDYNSLYPSIMYNEEFPVGRPLKVENYRYCESDYGFVEIETYIPKNFNISPLPYRKNYKLIFPTGYIQGVYPLPFLNLLKRLNIDFVCKRALLFDHEKLFQKYVEDLYKKRKDNKNNYLGTVCKLLLNSLYGKFAQKIERENILIHPNSTDYERYDLILVDELNDIWKYQTFVELPYILPAISAYVTAYGQIKLFNFLYNYECYYCDTDSIFTTEKLPVSDNLGDLKLVDEIKEAVFLAPKIYSYVTNQGFNKITLKGIPTRHLTVTHQDFLNMLENNKEELVSVQYPSMFSFKESVKRFNKFLIYDIKSKSISAKNDKRTYFYGKNYSEPLYLSKKRSE